MKDKNNTNYKRTW